MSQNNILNKTEVENIHYWLVNLQTMMENQKKLNLKNVTILEKWSLDINKLTSALEKKLKGAEK